MFKTSQKRLKKDVFCVTPLRRHRHISKRCLFRDVSEKSQKHLSQVILVFQKYVTKMISCNFRRLITISDKKKRATVRTTKEMKRFVGALHRYQSVKSSQWADIYVRVLASQGIVKTQ